ncbi:MAG: hypothetical protein JWQ74_2174 [Marmoricola sp.]|nr:hypothetical protein [Marmoricola sp.]
MPEPIDPFRELENFGTGGIVTTPLAGPEVRRLGDRHRARRRTAVVAATAAVVVAALVPTFVLAGRDRPSTPGPATPPTAVATPTVVTFPDPGLDITRPRDVATLTGTSAAFQAFVADQVRLAEESATACPGASPGVTVRKWSSSGYAVGSFHDCTSYQALWVDTNGTWIQGMATQDVWNCTTLRYYTVPTSFAGQCARESGGFGPDGTGLLKLGMTRAQVEATGTRVDKVVDGTSCSPMFERQPSANPGGDGLVHQQLGLIQIDARADDITPERISLGSTYAEAKAAYPALHREADGWVVPLTGGAQYRMEFTGPGPDDTVTALVLDSGTATCTS